MEEMITKNQIMNMLVDMNKNMATKDDLSGFATKDDLENFRLQTENSFTELYEFLQENMVMRSEFNVLCLRVDHLDQNLQITKLEICDRMDTKLTDFKNELRKNIDGKIERLVNVLEHKHVIIKPEVAFVLKAP